MNSSLRYPILYWVRSIIVCWLQQHTCTCSCIADIQWTCTKDTLLLAKVHNIHVHIVDNNIIIIMRIAHVLSCTNSAISLQEVALSSTLYLGEYARPGERVTFTCEARDTSILEWHSDKYIGTGGDRIEILRSGDGRNETRLGGETVATTVSVSTYSGVTVIISQLHIMTSEQIPTSSVMCAINGDGPRETISFTTTGIKAV